MGKRMASDLNISCQQSLPLQRFSIATYIQPECCWYLNLFAYSLDKPFMFELKSTHLTSPETHQSTSSFSSKTRVKGVWWPNQGESMKVTTKAPSKHWKRSRAPTKFKWNIMKHTKYHKKSTAVILLGFESFWNFKTLLELCFTSHSLHYGICGCGAFCFHSPMAPADDSKEEVDIDAHLMWNMEDHDRICRQDWFIISSFPGKWYVQQQQQQQQQQQKQPYWVFSQGSALSDQVAYSMILASFCCSWKPIRSVKVEKRHVRSASAVREEWAKVGIYKTSCDHAVFGIVMASWPHLSFFK